MPAQTKTTDDSIVYIRDQFAVRFEGDTDEWLLAPKMGRAALTFRHEFRNTSRPLDRRFVFQLTGSSAEVEIAPTDAGAASGRSAADNEADATNDSPTLPDAKRASPGHGRIPLCYGDVVSLQSVEARAHLHGATIGPRASTHDDRMTWVVLPRYPSQARTPPPSAAGAKSARRDPVRYGDAVILFDRCDREYLTVCDPIRRITEGGGDSAAAPRGSGRKAKRRDITAGSETTAAVVDDDGVDGTTNVPVDGGAEVGDVGDTVGATDADPRVAAETTAATSPLLQRAAMLAPAKSAFPRDRASFFQQQVEMSRDVCSAFIFRPLDPTTGCLTGDPSAAPTAPPAVQEAQQPRHQREPNPQQQQKQRHEQAVKDRHSVKGGAQKRAAAAAASPNNNSNTAATPWGNTVSGPLRAVTLQHVDSGLFLAVSADGCQVALAPQADAGIYFSLNPGGDEKDDTARPSSSAADAGLVLQLDEPYRLHSCRDGAAIGFPPTCEKDKPSRASGTWDHLCELPDRSLSNPLVPMLGAFASSRTPILDLSAGSANDEMDAAGGTVNNTTPSAAAAAAAEAQRVGLYDWGSPALPMPALPRATALPSECMVRRFAITPMVVVSEPVLRFGDQVAAAGDAPTEAEPCIMPQSPVAFGDTQHTVGRPSEQDRPLPLTVDAAVTPVRGPTVGFDLSGVQEDASVGPDLGSRAGSRAFSTDGPLPAFSCEFTFRAVDTFNRNAVSQPDGAEVFVELNATSDEAQVPAKDEARRWLTVDATHARTTRLTLDNIRVGASAARLTRFRLCPVRAPTDVADPLLVADDVPSALRDAAISQLAAQIHQAGLLGVGVVAERFRKNRLLSEAAAAVLVEVIRRCAVVPAAITVTPTEAANTATTTVGARVTGASWAPPVRRGGDPNAAIVVECCRWLSSIGSTVAAQAGRVRVAPDVANRVVTVLVKHHNVVLDEVGWCIMPWLPLVSDARVMAASVLDGYLRRALESPLGSALFGGASAGVEQSTSNTHNRTGTAASLAQCITACCVHPTFGRLAQDFITPWLQRGAGAGVRLCGGDLDDTAEQRALEVLLAVAFGHAANAAAVRDLAPAAALIVVVEDPTRRLAIRGIACRLLVAAHAHRTDTVDSRVASASQGPDGQASSPSSSSSSTFVSASTLTGVIRRIIMGTIKAIKGGSVHSATAAAPKGGNECLIAALRAIPVVVAMAAAASAQEKVEGPPGESAAAAPAAGVTTLQTRTVLQQPRVPPAVVYSWLRLLARLIHALPPPWKSRSESFAILDTLVLLCRSCPEFSWTDAAMSAAAAGPGADPADGDAADGGATEPDSTTPTAQLRSFVSALLRQFFIEGEGVHTESIFEVLLKVATPASFVGMGVSTCAKVPQIGQEAQRRASPSQKDEEEHAGPNATDEGPVEERVSTTDAQADAGAKNRPETGGVNRIDAAAAELVELLALQSSLDGTTDGDSALKSVTSAAEAFTTLLLQTAASRSRRAASAACTVERLHVLLADAIRAAPNGSGDSPVTVDGKPTTIRRRRVSRRSTTARGKASSSAADLSSEYTVALWELLHALIVRAGSDASRDLLPYMAHFNQLSDPAHCGGAVRVIGHMLNVLPDAAAYALLGPAPTPPPPDDWTRPGDRSRLKYASLVKGSAKSFKGSRRTQGTMGEDASFPLLSNPLAYDFHAAARLVLWVVDVDNPKDHQGRSLLRNIRCAAESPKVTPVTCVAALRLSEALAAVMVEYDPAEPLRTAAMTADGRNLPADARGRHNMFGCRHIEDIVKFHLFGTLGTEPTSLVGTLITVIGTATDKPSLAAAMSCLSYLLDTFRVEAQATLALCMTHNGYADRSDYSKFFATLRDAIVYAPPSTVTSPRITSTVEQAVNPLRNLALQVVQRMCEGHYHPLQNQLRVQSKYPRSINVIRAIARLSLEDLVLRTVEPTAELAAAALVEAMQGPCIVNQFVMSRQLKSFIRNADPDLGRGVPAAAVDALGAKIHPTKSAWATSTVTARVIARWNRLVYSVCLAFLEGNATREMALVVCGAARLYADVRAEELQYDPSSQNSSAPVAAITDGNGDAPSDEEPSGDDSEQRAPSKSTDGGICLRDADALYILLCTTARPLGASTRDRAARRLLVPAQSKWIRHMSRRIQCVTVARDGLLVECYFPVPKALSAHLTSAERDAIVAAVDRTGDVSRLTDFLRLAGAFLARVDTLERTPMWWLTSGLILRRDLIVAMAQVVSLFINVWLLALAEFGWTGTNNALLPPGAYVTVYYVAVGVLIAIEVLLTIVFILGDLRVHLAVEIGGEGAGSRKGGEKAAKRVRSDVGTSADESEGTSRCLRRLSSYARAATASLNAAQTTAQAIVLFPATWRRAFFLAVPFLALFVSPVFWAIHLLQVVWVVPALTHLATAITENVVNLACTGLLLVLVLFAFATVKFYHQSGDMDPNGSTGPHGNCDTLLRCAATVLLFGIRTNIADVTKPPTTTTFVPRFFYDMAFEVAVTLIVLNLVFGVIVDKFNELRQAREEAEADHESKCFVCGAGRDEIDSSASAAAVAAGNFFEQHCATEHNMWTYLRFMYYLRHKPRDDYTGMESYFADCFARCDPSAFPIASRQQPPAASAADTATDVATNLEAAAGTTSFAPFAATTTAPTAAVPMGTVAFNGANPLTVVAHKLTDEMTKVSGAVTRLGAEFARLEATVTAASPASPAVGAPIVLVNRGAAAQASSSPPSLASPPPPVSTDANAEVAALRLDNERLTAHLAAQQAQLNRMEAQLAAVLNGLLTIAPAATS